MKKRLSILMCLATLAGVPALAPAQEQDLGNSIASLPPAPSPGAPVNDRLRGDADDAHRRESDLAAQVAEQERTNAMLRDQIRRVGNDPTGLGRDLANASEEASTLRKKVADQRQRRDAAEDKLAAARDTAMARYEGTGAAKAARDAVQQATAELDRLSQPIFEQLTQTPAYQEQQALVDAAAQAGEAIQGFGAGESRMQAEADAAFDAAMAGLRGMEDAAISADPAAANARTSLKVAQDTLDGLRRENEKKIAGDPAVDAARFALDLEEKLLSDSTAQLATAEKRLSALRQANAPQGGGAAELTAQLRDGEARLRDLNDRLDQARIASRDADERLAAADDALARRPAGSGEIPAPGYDAPPAYPPAYDNYDGGYYGGYYGSPYYYPPTYGYGYVYPRYGPYYAYDYCPPYFSSGLFLGFGYSSYSHYRSYRPYYASYRPYYHGGYYAHAPYYRSPYFGRDWRGGNSFRGSSYDGGRPLPGNSRYTTSGRRYDYARFNATETRRDRDSRSAVDAARAATADAERDFRYRSGVRTYDYPGSSRYSRDATSVVRPRTTDGVRRDSLTDSAGRTTPRSGSVLGSTGVERSDADSAARRARAADEAARSRIEMTRPRDAGDSRSTRIESRSDTSTGSEARRARGGDTSAEAAAARRRASDDATARARSSDDSARRSRASEETSRARGSDGSSSRVRVERAAPAPPSSSVDPGRTRGSDSGGSRGARVERASPTPPRSVDSGRGSSRGGSSSVDSGRSSSRGGSPPPSFDSGRGSARGSSPAAPSGGDRGGSSFRGSPAPEAPRASRGGDSGGAGSSSRGGGGGSSPSSSGSTRGGSSSSDGGGRRGR